MTTTTTTTKSIRVTKETYDRLAELGSLSDSFDSVIKKLLDENKKETQKKK